MHCCQIAVLLLAFTAAHTVVGLKIPSINAQLDNLSDTFERVHVVPIADKEGNLHWNYNDEDKAKAIPIFGNPDEEAAIHLSEDPMDIVRSIGTGLGSFASQVGEMTSSAISKLKPAEEQRPPLAKPSKNASRKRSMVVPAKARSVHLQTATGTGPDDYFSNFSHQKLELGHWYHKWGTEYDITDKEWELLLPEDKKHFIKIVTQADVEHMKAEPVYQNLGGSILAPHVTALEVPGEETVKHASSPVQHEVRFRSDVSGRELELGKWYRKIGSAFDITDDEYSVLPDSDKALFTLIKTPQDLDTLAKRAKQHDAPSAASAPVSAPSGPLPASEVPTSGVAVATPLESSGPSTAPLGQPVVLAAQTPVSEQAPENVVTPSAETSNPSTVATQSSDVQTPVASAPVPAVEPAPAAADSAAVQPAAIPDAAAAPESKVVTPEPVAKEGSTSTPKQTDVSEVKQVESTQVAAAEPPATAPVAPVAGSVNVISLPEPVAQEADSKPEETAVAPEPKDVRSLYTGSRSKLPKYSSDWSQGRLQQLAPLVEKKGMDLTSQAPRHESVPTSVDLPSEQPSEATPSKQGAQLVASLKRRVLSPITLASL